MTLLTALVTDQVLGVGESFSQDEEMRLMGRQTQHDEIRIRSIDAVARVWVVAWLCSLRPNEVKDLMFAFAGNKSVRKEDNEIPPSWVRVHLLNNVELKGFGQPVHKLCARGDDV